MVADKIADMLTRIRNANQLKDKVTFLILFMKKIKTEIN